MSYVHVSGLQAVNKVQNSKIVSSDYYYVTKWEGSESVLKSYISRSRYDCQILSQDDTHLAHGHASIVPRLLVARLEDLQTKKKVTR